MSDGTPGWFRDPNDETLARWHDGHTWTEHTLVIADQTPGVEPEPPDIPAPTMAVPMASSRLPEPDPEFTIPRRARGGSDLPSWAKVAAPLVVLLVVVVGYFMVSGGGDDDPDETATVDTVAASLDEAVAATRRAGLPKEDVSDAAAKTLIERICDATTRPAAVDSLGEDLGQLSATTSSELRQWVGALGIGADRRCHEDLRAAPDLIDDLQAAAVLAFASTTTSPTLLPTDGGVDAGVADAGVDGGTDGGGTTGTTKAGSKTSTTKKSGPTTTAPTTTTTKPLPQVLPNTACSPEGAKGQNKITGGGLTCMKKCNSTSLAWRSGPCPTTPTAPPTTAPPATTAPPVTTATTTGGTTPPTN